MLTQAGGGRESDSNAVCAAFAASPVEGIGARLPSTFSLALPNLVAETGAGDEDGDGAGAGVCAGRWCVDAESITDCSAPLGDGAIVDGYTYERELRQQSELEFIDATSQNAKLRYFMRGKLDAMQVTQFIITIKN